MIWAIVCAVIFAVALLGAFLMSSGGAFNQRVLLSLYERMGPQIYGNQADTDWTLLMEYLQLHGNEHILDVGTAVGDFPLILAQQSTFHGQIIGIDWSEQMLSIARRKSAELTLDNTIKFENVDVRDGLPYPNDTFDRVVCIGVLETVREQALVMYDLGRVLKPHGILILSQFRGWSNWSADRIQNWYERQLDTFGMELETVLPFRPSHDLMVIRLRGVDEPAATS
jgi:ubiquinone/menaquinone biosynthesis C-methylase UbiE